MGIFKKIENKVSNWLFKEEIEVEKEVVEYYKQNMPSKEELEESKKRELEVIKQEFEKMKREDLSKPPTYSDINRYYGYYTNFIENIKLIEENTGEKCPYNVPSSPVSISDYSDKAKKDGWRYLRMSCGLPTGNLNEPRKPWVAGVKDKKWTVEEPEIHMKTNNGKND